MVVLSPEKGREIYSLYVYGNVSAKSREEGRGTYMRCSGVCALFYFYERHRVAYIVREHDEGSGYTAAELPSVRQPVDILYKCTGQKLDRLRFEIFSARRRHGGLMFSMPASFWQKLGGMLDSFSKSRKVNAFSTENIERLMELYSIRMGYEDI